MILIQAYQLKMELPVAIVVMPPKYGENINFYIKH